MLRKSMVEFGRGTNNEAEFNALEMALSDTVVAMKADGAKLMNYRVRILTDSQILRNRMAGKHRVKIHAKYKESSERMILHANRCLGWLIGFKSWSIAWQPRANNVEHFGH